MQRRLSPLSLAALAALLLPACRPQPPAAPTPVLPTPTIIGADLLQASPTHPISLAPTIYERPGMCSFPYVFAPREPPQHAGVYRFNWQGAELTLDTAGGPLSVTGTAEASTGPRAVAILHNGPLPPRVVVDVNFVPDAWWVFIAARSTMEIRNSAGAAVQQTVFDPPGDVRFGPEHLDILQVDRLFGPGAEFLIRIRLAEPPPLQSTPVWTWDSRTVLLGDRRYTARVFADGKVESGMYTSLGGYRTWDGGVEVEPTSAAWVFEASADLPFSAATSTSAADGDATDVFDVEAMRAFFEAARQACGP